MEKDKNETEKTFSKEDLEKAFNAGREKFSWCNLGGWHTENKYDNFKSWFEDKDK